MSRTSLEHIAGLLAFFELWNFPLTASEIRRFFNDETIADDWLQGIFFAAEANGQTFFSTTAEVADLLPRRREGVELSQKLQEKAEKFLRILRHFPFIRGLAVTNTPAMQVASAESDIDLFVVVQPGRMWTARFFSTLWFVLFGLRARKGDTKGKFCLSFFVDERHTNLFLLKQKKDIYLALWLATLRPFSGKNFFQKLRQDNYAWVEEEAGVSLQFDDSFLRIPLEKQSGWQKFWEFLLPRWTEKILRWLLLKKAQKFRTPGAPEYAPEMIFEEHIQKLHHPDLRTEIQESWQTKIREFQALRKTFNHEA